MKECTENLINMIMDQLSSAPESQVSEKIKTQVVDFNGTLSEKFDLIVSISKEPLTEISSFVKEFCALDKHYKKPE